MSARRDPPCLRAAVQALGKVASAADQDLAIVAQQPRHHCAEDKAAEVDILHSARGRAQAGKAGRHQALFWRRAPALCARPGQLHLQAEADRAQVYNLSSPAISCCQSLVAQPEFRAVVTTWPSRHAALQWSCQARERPTLGFTYVPRHACLAYGLPI